TGIFVFAIALVSIWTGVMVGTREPERYVGFGILNAEGTAGPFPTEVQVGQNITTYFEVTNHLGSEETLKVRVSLANQYSAINFITGVSNATVLAEYSNVLRDGETWHSDPVTVSIDHPGVNLSVTYEVFRLSGTGYEFVPDKVLYFRLNCSA
ncbi:MAG: DUF1616 domain-containing protein, partial [Promethearchaeota archaeon]